MADKTKAIKSWIKIKLRGAAMQWSPKNWAKQNARVARGKYKCADCGEIFGPKEIEMDHVDRVMPFEKYDKLVDELKQNTELRKLTKTVDDDKRFKDLFDIFIYISRLFIQSDGYQALCRQCHQIKTDLEQELAGTSHFKKKVKEKS